MIFAFDGRRAVKFVDVPAAYSLQDIKHAQFAGMYMDFVEGESWLTLNEKRLFREPESPADSEETVDLGPPTESAADWPLMSPEELKEALAAVPPYEELLARWKVVEDSMRTNGTTLPPHKLFSDSLLEARQH